MDDPYDLERFVEAQRPIYPQAADELRAGEKNDHWIWYVFPQLRGLGRSSTSARYGIGSLEEAQAYLAHPVLGPRLRECTELVLAVEGRSAEQIFHGDAVKVRSSMTLFAEAAPVEPIFQRVLDRYYDGINDPATLEILHSAGS